MAAKRARRTDPPDDLPTYRLLTGPDDAAFFAAESAKPSHSGMSYTGHQPLHSMARKSSWRKLLSGHLE
jgi:hypothetical protein